jgi:hypothetical protein
VTDEGEDDHQLEIFDFGVSLGLTSVPGGTHVNCDIDPLACLASSPHSDGTFSLAQGNHSVTIAAMGANVFSIGWSSGTGAFRLDAATAGVPEPLTLGVFCARHCGTRPDVAQPLSREGMTQVA